MMDKLREVEDICHFIDPLPRIAAFPLEGGEMLRGAGDPSERTDAGREPMPIFFRWTKLPEFRRPGAAKSFGQLDYLAVEEGHA